MYLYTEVGLPLPVNNTVIKVEKKPETTVKDKIIDVKNYNKKLFVQQITKIVSNQGNKFEDIAGEDIESDFNNKKRSTILLEGFNEGIIIDYKSTSFLYRYEAQSFQIKGKGNALAFLDLLDKEVQTLIAGNGIKRIVDMDLKLNKTLNYIFTANAGYDVTAIKFMQLQAYCSTDFANPDDAIFTITIRIDKPARK